MAFFVWHFWRCLPAVLALLACLAAGLPARSQAIAPGLETQQPILRHPAYDRRVAIIVVGQPLGGAARAALGHSDAQDYRIRLRQLGFEVTTVGPSIRPDMQQHIREAANRVNPGSEVAVFFVGSLFAAERDHYVVPASAAPDLEARPAMLQTEAIAVSDIMRRLAARGPRHLVAIVDECRNVERPGEPCALSEVAALNGSVIATHRPARPVGGAPVAGLSSAGGIIRDLMQREGLTFLQFGMQLRERFNGTDLALSTTPVLSGSFTFLPADFHVGLPHACNRVDPAADAALVRTLNADANVTACDEAVRLWPSNHFNQRRATAVEQRVFQRAVASCIDRAPADAYLSGYPGGRYRDAVQKFINDCRQPEVRPTPSSPPPPSRLTVSSGTGWQTTYDSGLLRVDDVDRVSPQGAINTTLLTIDGRSYPLFISVSRNEKCESPTSYFDNVVVGNRRRPPTNRGTVTTTANWDGIWARGRGVRLQEGWRDIEYVDAVFVSRTDPRTTIHVGTRFPPGMDAGLNNEFTRIVQTLALPARPHFIGCR